MKSWLVLLSVFSSVCVASALSTNEVSNGNGTLFQTQNSGRGLTNFVLKLTKPNELSLGRLTLSGIGIEVTKTPNPLQLFNPRAPIEYGSPEDNVVRDPIHGRVTGLKLFSIRF